MSATSAILSKRHPYEHMGRQKLHINPVEYVISEGAIQPTKNYKSQRQTFYVYALDRVNTATK